jgi:hypothetical protein
MKSHLQNSKGDFVQLGALEQWLREESADEVIQKKQRILQRAAAHLSHHVSSSHFTRHRLPDEAGFLLSADSKPDYFLEPFVRHDIEVSATGEFYDYQPHEGREDFWLDFANRVLGGGVLHHGFVQEEKMFCEIPELFNVVLENVDSGGLRTRGGGDRPLTGSPTPICFKDVYRSVDIQGLYGSEIFSIGEEELMGKMVFLDPPQKVSIIAAAAPRLQASKEQWKSETIEDFFNTACAAMTLAREQSARQPQFNTGQFGCGAFFNDAVAAYVLQRLAAEFVGVHIKFYGYPDEKALETEKVYRNVVRTFEQESERSVENLLGVVGHIRA